MQKSCATCSATFDITKDDLAFYEKVSPEFGGKTYAIPPPTLCPTCRYQRRLCFRNERNLYHRKCDASGKPMISMHPASSPFPVYHITEWMKDSWDPKDFGHEYDFSRTFADQFRALCQEVPHFSAFVDPHMDQNSEYTNCSSEAKNCYLITQAEKNEDCYYSRGINNCTSCCDCLRVHKCELCYECISMRNCYNCSFSEDCDNCSDCLFSSELRGCKHCFGCHGLTQKEYYMFNEPVGKEEWEKKVQSLELTRDVIGTMVEKSAGVRLSFPQRATHMVQCEGCTGDDLLQCKNCHECFDCNNLEDCSYCNELANDAKDCRDFSMFGLNCELCYECNGGGYNMRSVLFSNHCWNTVSNLLYCESCFPSVKNCFGCFGLRQSEYCILNKQYSKEEYESLVPKIIEHMQSTCEWGEFFPASISPYGYNESLAGEFFPLTREEVQKRGWHWYEETEAAENYLGPDVSIPASLKDIGDDICKKILRCSLSGKPYRITTQELGFYRQIGVPVPALCPQERHMKRMSLRRPRTLWDRNCAQCSKEIQTTYAPERPEIVTCEDCYLKTVY